MSHVLPLPRQTDLDSHVVSMPRELDLNSYHGSLAGRFNAVPVLRTSTAFLTFLSQNLSVDPSDLSSHANTPTLEPPSTDPRRAPPSSPLPLSLGPPATDPEPDRTPPPPPPLSVSLLKEEGPRLDAIRLVADSVAQQQRVAARHLLLHPYLVLGLAAVLGLTLHLAWRVRARPGLAPTLVAALLLVHLLVIWQLTRGYVRAAHVLRRDGDWDWTVSSAAGAGAAATAPTADTILGLHQGSDLVGALVLRLETSRAAPASTTAASGAGASGKRRARASTLRGGRGLIRAWTVAAPHRRRGLGTDLLHEAVRTTRERCGRDAEIGFAREHAHSLPVLPHLLNADFRRVEQRAARTLERVLAEWGGVRWKRSF